MQLVVFLLLLLSWCCIVVSNPLEKQRAVEELTPETFDEFIGNSSQAPVVVLFYAPWSFFAQQVIFEFDTVLQKLRLHEPPIQVGAVDAHRYQAIAQSQSITTFPQIKLYTEGASLDYEQQGYSWQQIVKWVNGHIDRDHVLKSADDVDHYLNDNDLNVVGLFHDETDAAFFSKASRQFDDVLFAEARGNDLAHNVSLHLAQHARLRCETISVGSSDRAPKFVVLPRPSMDCSCTPRNPQRPEWSDKFAVQVNNSELSVARAEARPGDGWGQDLKLQCCDSQPSLESGEVTKDLPIPSVVMFMPHDERFAVFHGNVSDSQSLVEWIATRRLPLVSHFEQDALPKLLEGPVRRPIVFLIKSNEEPVLEAALREAAPKVRSQAVICFSGYKDPLERRLMDLLGVDEAALPIVALVEGRDLVGAGQTMRKYRLEANITSDAVVNFVEDFKAGTLRPWRRSEIAPEPGDPMGPVQILVGSTFHDAVHDVSKDVLVNIYAPWCGHCKQFEPHYKAVAKKLKHVPSLRICKLDGTRNEVDGLIIQGFPTIVFFPAGGTSPKKSPEFYSGSREPDAIVKWLKEVCTTKFNEHPPRPNPNATPAEHVSGLLDDAEDDL